MEPTLIKKLACTYFMAFNLAEAGHAEKAFLPLDDFLGAHNQPLLQDTLFDNEGAPTNASPEVYDAFNAMLDEPHGNDFRKCQTMLNEWLEALELGIANPTYFSHELTEKFGQ